MRDRLLFGVLMAVSIVVVVLALPPWGLGAVVLFALYHCAGEYQAMARPEGDGLDRAIFLLALGVTVSWPLVRDHLFAGYTHSAALTGGMVILILARLTRPVPIEDSARKLGLDALGLCWIGLSFPLIYMLRDRPNGGWFIVMVMAITFLQDTGAYFAGKFLGKHPLAPKLSPKKTIEGVVGGVTAATCGAFIARTWFPGHETLTVTDCIILGVVGALMGVCGDLFESMLKRAFGVKDSGTLIPGHGGFLDRVDGLLFVGPFAYYYTEAFVL